MLLFPVFVRVNRTSRYIEKIITCLTLIGARFYITLVCSVAGVSDRQGNKIVHFCGTSLLIIVVVTMDFMAQGPILHNVATA